jgi:hypothetical protein
LGLIRLTAAAKPPPAGHSKQRKLFLQRADASVPRRREFPLRLDAAAFGAALAARRAGFVGLFLECAAMTLRRGFVARLWRLVAAMFSLLWTKQ